MSKLDRELSRAFAAAAAVPPSRKPGAGRTFRPGTNALRRMKVGRMVREYRHTVVIRQRVGNTRADWHALARELERRNLPESARQVRQQQAPAATGTALATAVVSGAALGVLMAAQEKGWNEDRELSRLEAAVDAQADELGVADHDAELARETTALSQAEFLADLEEVGASDATIDAEIMGGIENPQEAIEQLAEAETAELPVVAEEEVVDVQADAPAM